MDAREYLARKGLDGERDRERPNTLEEKAWSRAREASDHRPRAGTPHDWEDWERYHEVLAEGAESLQQKIDQEAHRRARERAGRAAVETCAPAAASPALEAGSAARSRPVPTEVRLALLAMAVLMPPLAVGLAQGGGRRVAINLLLTLLGWLPGVVHAWRWLGHRHRP
ncbi:YqaE/Pmp3 family membrane protein [Halomonas maura]|uniref:YqaE/Pmp3 family membrane protein n=1 Tax=Halomonas maura TaxID=117606 RepID=UPI0025B334E1|nr:YqaE/Pmp3 family membrane protein [Halomonas maura]MDN3555447.1 YqaE/Pmp3 family membrane protein [Halomonas maura]